MEKMIVQKNVLHFNNIIVKPLIGFSMFKMDAHSSGVIPQNGRSN